ncbi:cytochrome P450 81Q32-like [Cannabis sativa]|uniref:cytochrome P450 81Q32-like n=1 Tax=Cannabis sativa TaxID=3483 RepID=UPI0029CA75B4|nr:cytochrome P450 81Q32-like [Cannabis sativa]
MIFSYLLTPLLTLTLIISIVVLSFKTEKRQYKNLPPTPPSLPIIGHLHLVKPPIHRALHNLSTKYGEIFLLRLGFRRVVVVSSSTIAQECLTKNDIVFANRPHFLLAKHVGYNSSNVVDCSYGEHWRNLRRIGAIEIFSSGRLNLFINSRRDEVIRLLKKLSCQDSNRVELKSMFQELTFNIITRMVAGKRYCGDDVANEEEAKLFRDTLRTFMEFNGAGNAADFLPILNWIPINNFENKVKRLGKTMDSLLEGLIKEHKSNKDENRMNTVIEHLLSLQDSQPEYYTNEIIKGFVMQSIAGGTDTSALTLEWAMSNLLNHPHVLQKVKTEIDSEIGQRQLMEESDISKLPYLQCVISETFRLYPVGPLLVPHYSSNDCNICGYDVPRDTILLVNIWAIHRDPKLWEDAENFKPERFENINIENEFGYKLMPFGVGRRSCPGRGLASRVIGLALGSLIQCFDWEKVDHNKIDMTEGKGLTMPKVVSLEAICKARPIMNYLMSQSN